MIRKWGNFPDSAGVYQSIRIPAPVKEVSDAVIGTRKAPETAPQGNERGVDTIPYLLCGPIGHKDGRDIYHDRRYPIETGNI